MASPIDVCIVGAGPYGLSIAAHLRGLGMDYRIFGCPMESWRKHMPHGMFLKSDGFASNLSAPQPGQTLRSFCAERSIPYDDTHLPVSLETFIEYGLSFQRRVVPDLDPRSISKITPNSGVFLLETDDGESLVARRVVLAVGIRDFAFIPDWLSALPRHLITHSSEHPDPSIFHGREVSIIGGGASAIDLAVLLQETGAKVCIIARDRAIHFHNPPPPGKRPLHQRLRSPSSGLGPGWKSRFYTDFPSLFRHMPAPLRVKIVREHLGPAPGWSIRERAANLPMFLSAHNFEAIAAGDHVLLRFLNADGRPVEHRADHVIAATGYLPNVHRLKFLDPGIQQQLHSFECAPVLSAHLESSVPGLYFVGLASASTFGPMMRFAYGADWTARHLSNHLYQTAQLHARQAIPVFAPQEEIKII